MGLVSLTGSIVWKAHAELATRLSPDGGAEQDADEWWRLVRSTARDALASGAVRPEQVVAVSTTGQWASTVPVDEAGIPVGPCILWMDTRGGRHARKRFKILPDGKVFMLWRNAERQPTEPVDREVAVIRLDRADGSPLAVLYHYACHPVVLGPDNLQYSADYVGTACKTVEDELKTTCLFLQGACGDLNPYMDKTPLKDGGIDGTKLPPLHASGSVTGTVRDDVADDLGLPRGVVVVAGTPDLHSAAVGAGTAGG